MSQGKNYQVEQKVIPVIEERPVIERTVEKTGAAKIRKTVVTEHVQVEAPSFKEEVVVQRVPIDREVSELQEPFEREGVLVIPIYEEVVKKQLVLREEIRVTKIRHAFPGTVEIPIRREIVEVTHSVDSNDAPTPGDSAER